MVIMLSTKLIKICIILVDLWVIKIFKKLKLPLIYKRSNIWLQFEKHEFGDFKFVPLLENYFKYIEFPYQHIV